LTKSSHFIEYMKLHRLSLIQDLESVIKGQGYTEEYLRGAIGCIDHLLSVATDIMENSNERIYE
jgi:hypothetical protein